MAKTAAAPKQYDPLKDGVPKKPMALFIAGGVLLVALVAGIIIAVAAGGDEPAAGEGDAVAFRAVTIEGSALAAFPSDAQGIADPSTDPAIGQTVPTIVGKTFTGKDLTVGPTGEPQIILFVAHWCPHCQAEVPKIVEWQNSGTIPDSINVQAVSTSVKEAQGNYPPASWLERESWKGDVLADDSGSTGSQAYGLQGFPYFVAVDGNGTVVLRGSGELTDADLTRIVQTLEAGVAS